MADRKRERAPEARKGPDPAHPQPEAGEMQQDDADEPDHGRKGGHRREGPDDDERE